MTREQEIELVRRMLKDEPMATVGHLAVLKLAEAAINANAKELTLTTEATFNNKVYDCKLEVTYKLKKS